ncbi:M20 family metallopeptidase [Paenibacillus sp. J22TS3]|uniref:M20 metallopeptidase family protein n=1 Tax=Paenibacillus sp. J22TS3 TaxID=2807192 RepID=UPI001B1B8148|nr:M20 family metallopeptidase [Paenibacillus sp. J22TS3]GIP21616.1 peptidase M20 [Paenibacillus sp. J22TS3]
MNRNSLWAQAVSLGEEITAARRYLHKYPELGFEEVLTSAYLAEELSKLGLLVRTGVAGTGIIALLEGASPGPVIALRADMDALPLKEQTGLAFASVHEGRMHACGHDGHMAMLLGAAKLLAGLKGELAGTVKFIFQPAEEMLGGARHMIRAGALESPRVDAIIGLHLWPDFPTGQFGLKEGTIMASMDHVDITVHGRAGHGAAPHQAVDAIYAASQVLTALQSLISRESDPADPVVLSMGSVHGGSLPNIIADRVEMKGTVRAVRRETREYMAQRIPELAESVARGLNARAEVRYEFGYPPTVNDGELVRLAELTLEEGPGRSSVKRLAHSQMTSEDMAYYMERVPGAFVLVGTGGDGPGEFPLHHPRMMIDERSLTLGAAFLADYAVRLLREFQNKFSVTEEISASGTGDSMQHVE